MPQRLTRSSIYSRTSLETISAIEALGLERDLPNMDFINWGKSRVDERELVGCRVFAGEDNEDIHDFGSVETEFPAIVFNDTLTSEATLSCEPTKTDLKTDSKNDNDKVNMPLLPSPKPTVSYFDGLDFFKYFKNEFPAIVYNDAQKSKSDLLTEPILNPQHIDEFNLKDETSLSEYDEEEQNVICFNDLFPFNVIYPDELKTDTDNDNDKVDIEHSSEDLSVKPLPDLINTDVGAYAHGTVYTAYSLNEYSVFDTGVNTAYPRDLQKEIDELVEVSGNLKVLES
ncbi:hypothetical protein Tco_1273194 [Tanacetum coccineum]